LRHLPKTNDFNQICFIFSIFGPSFADMILTIETLIEQLMKFFSPTAEEMSSLDRVISKAESIIESIRAQEGLSVKSVDKKQDFSSRVETAKTPVAIKVPLSPRLQTRGKRRHSSGSDESIILSQNG
jgi:hypothetical protein